MMQTDEPAVVNVEEEKEVYYCEHCTFKTHYYSRLVSHSVVHSLDRPFACEYCHYAAKRKSDLKKHLVHKHKMTNSEKSMHDSEPASSQSDGNQAANASQQSQKTVHVTYTLSPEQEVAESPISIHNDAEDISIHSGSNTPTVKVELNDDSEVCNTRQYEYTIPLQVANTFTDNNPVAVNLPPILFPHPRISAPFTPTISSIGSHVISNSHKPYPSTVTSTDLHPASEIQNIISSKNSPSNKMFSPLNIASAINIKDVSTLTNQCFFCEHCNVLFFDNGLYVIHMGLHHSENPWQCNLCGQAHKDVYSFTLHFVTQHKS